MTKTTMGYKGFDKDLKCRDFQYEIGKTYAIDKKELKICSKGFHFCYELEDVKSYYALPDFQHETEVIGGIDNLTSLLRGNSSNRFCEVEILGDVDTVEEKSATDIIRIVRELTKQEIIEIINKKYWDAAWELQQKYPHYLIGGSMALMMVGLLPKDCRVFHDLDLTAPHYVVLNDDFDPTPTGRSRGVAAHAKYKGILIDFFIAPTEQPKRITYEGRHWNITNISTILKAKVAVAF